MLLHLVVEFEKTSSISTHRSLCVVNAAPGSFSRFKISLRDKLWHVQPSFHSDK
jgi:hypothetical protein